MAKSNPRMLGEKVAEYVSGLTFDDDDVRREPARYVAAFTAAAEEIDRMAIYVNARLQNIFGLSRRGIEKQIIIGVCFVRHLPSGSNDNEVNLDQFDRMMNFIDLVSDKLLEVDSFRTEDLNYWEQIREDVGETSAFDEDFLSQGVLYATTTLRFRCRGRRNGSSYS